MPEYLSPGVYIEEVRQGAVPIEGVSTSTTGFVGQTERGPVGAQLVTSWLEFQRWYGGYLDDSDPTYFSYLPFAVQGFFDNGGQRLFIARVVGRDTNNAQNDAAAALWGLGTTGQSGQKLNFQALGPGDWGNRIFVRVRRGLRNSDRRPLFRVTVLYFTQPPPQQQNGDLMIDPLDPAKMNDVNRREPSAIEDFDNQGVNPEGGDYVINTFAGNSHLVRLAWNTPAGPFPELSLTDPNDTTARYVPLAGGRNGPAATLDDYKGTERLLTDGRIERTGLTALAAIDDISLLCVPDEGIDRLNTGGALTGEILNQCQLLHDRFGILQFGSTPGGIDTLRVPQDTSYGAIYYPWIRMVDPRTRGTRLVPPGGHVAGIYARVDVERGVHKAPANEEVRSIITQDIDANTKPLQVTINKQQHDILNPHSINVIRDFRNNSRGIRVWGARTMSSDGQWKYINVRRLFIFVEQSIQRGTQWVVFEPNDEPLWAQVRRSITNFLIRVWRSGALMGTTQDEAFFVKCDRTTMTQDDIDNGRLICLIGIAPVKPAEFVIFRFSQKTAEAEQ